MKNKPIYRYETHMHTSEVSLCGLSSAAEMVEAYIAAGYTGMVVTDHFFNGNCAVPRTLPWAERVEQLCRGYELAKAAVQGRRFHVFFGWEYNHHCTEFLTYGLDKAYLLAHPDILQWEVTDYIRRVQEAGGFVSQAHPYRQRDYMDRIRLFPKQVDAVEVYNATDPAAWNDMAKRYADMANLPYTAGSDAHQADIGPITGLAFDEELTTIADLVAAMRDRRGHIMEPVNGRRP